MANRVERILRASQPDKWSYIPTEQNPADAGTRCLQAAELQNSAWLNGPSHLQSKYSNSEYPLMDPDTDSEIRPHVRSMKSKVHENPSLGSERFKRISSWIGLVSAIAILKQNAAMSKKDDSHSSILEARSVEAFKHVERSIIKTVQQEQFEPEMLCLQKEVHILRNSKLISLKPFVDGSGILRVSGRLNKTEISEEQRDPIILLGSHHISTLLVLHHHELVKHQGRHFTEDAVRAAGLWIIG